MKPTKNSRLKNTTVEIILGIYLFSVLYSKTLLTVSMVLFFLLAFIDIDYNNKIHIRLSSNIVYNIRGFIGARQYFLITLMFILVLISGINSSDTKEWIHHIILKLPFLLLPFAFYSIGAFDKKQYFKIYYFFIVLMFLSTFPLILNYLLDKDNIDNLMKTGQVIHTPIDHIRYSLLLAFSVISSFILSKSSLYLHNNWKLKIISFIGFFNFIILHFLAVRSGLVVLYLILLYLIIKFNWDNRKKRLLLLLIPLFLFPVISYNFIPSFKNKIGYMLYDFEMHQKGNGIDYSDSERIYSWNVGIDIIKKHSVFGIGIGDLKTECIKTYKELYPNSSLKFKYPHNQFIYILSGSGILGLILFLIAFLYPILFNENWKDPFFLSFMLLILLSFGVENSLERSYSIAMYLFFILSALNYSKQKNKAKPKSITH